MILVGRQLIVRFRVFAVSKCPPPPSGLLWDDGDPQQCAGGCVLWAGGFSLQARHHRPHFLCRAAHQAAVPP
eukprot:scaffold145844_cov19-Tisochrysis_lutea.AAC.1